LKPKGKSRKSSDMTVDLRLYVAGQTARSLSAIANLRKICNKHLEAAFRVEAIDLAKSPVLASDHHVLAIPTLVRKLPVPIPTIIGDSSSTEQVLVGLDLQDVRGQR
jgi:circadian clock protein KaiB